MNFNFKTMDKIKSCQYFWAIVALIVAAVFGILLGMGTQCMIPVSFVCIGALAYENAKQGKTLLQSLVDGVLPALIGGLIICLCFILQL